METLELDLATFRRFKTKESQLQSLVDENSSLLLDGFYYKIEASDASMLNLVNAQNELRADTRDIYSRIDTVMSKNDIEAWGLGA